MVINKIMLKPSTLGHYSLANQIRRDRRIRAEQQKILVRQQKMAKLQDWFKVVFTGMLITMSLYVLRQYQLGHLQIGIPS